MILCVRLRRTTVQLKRGKINKLKKRLNFTYMNREDEYAPWLKALLYLKKIVCSERCYVTLLMLFRVYPDVCMHVCGVRCSINMSHVFFRHDLQVKKYIKIIDSHWKREPSVIQVNNWINLPEKTTNVRTPLQPEREHVLLFHCWYNLAYIDIVKLHSKAGDFKLGNGHLLESTGGCYVRTAKHFRGRKPWKWN